MYAFGSFPVENANEMCLFETHSHTPLCNHAVGWPTEYAAIAEQRGLVGLTVTCHNPMPSGFSKRVRMREDELGRYADLIAETREQWLGRIEVRLGLEADYFEGFESYLEKQLSQHGFHYVLGSVHPQLQEFRDRYWDENLVEVQRTYFRLLAVAAETRLFDSLAHPDLVKNFTSEAWQPERIWDDLCRSLDRIAATGVCMELNTSGVNKTISEMNPFPGMLSEMAIRGIPVTLGSDAHEPGRVADGFEEALDLLTEQGFAEVNVFENRRRVPIAIQAARDSLKLEPIPTKGAF